MKSGKLLKKPKTVKTTPSPLALYVHIPFCLSKCSYCDFYSVVDVSGDIVGDYVKSLISELSLHDALGWRDREVSSIFFGGGTPSLLSKKQLAEILRKISNTLPLSPHAEITLEMNPETVSDKHAIAWKEMGFNRASLGIQSFRSRELERLGRIHSKERSLEAFFTLRKAGFDNISVDLMFGLPNQSLKDWKESLAILNQLSPEHVSAYQLTLEPETPMERDWQNHLFHLPSEDLQIEYLEITRQTLEKQGFNAYELSNYAKPGRECRHNLAYWTGAEYWGVGSSAHSFQWRNQPPLRFWHPKDLHTYILSLKEGQLPPLEKESLSPEILGFDWLTTGLRLEKGIDFSGLDKNPQVHFSPETRQKIKEFIGSGHLTESAGCLSFTSSGRWVANEIFRELLP